MNIKEVQAGLADIKARMEALNEEKEILLIKLKHLQMKCPHSAGYSHRDMSGVSCFYCPDCEMDN